MTVPVIAVVVRLKAMNARGIDQPKSMAYSHDITTTLESLLMSMIVNSLVMKVVTENVGCQPHLKMLLQLLAALL